MSRKLFDRLDRLDGLIRMKATGRPAVLAARLDISESTLYEFINLMKDLGAPIKWDAYRSSYVYEPEGRMEVKFSKKIA
ncbi:MAG: hypothetical protein ACFB0B_18165 [Thermonemataceae bacterium]